MIWVDMDSAASATQWLLRADGVAHSRELPSSSLILELSSEAHTGQNQMTASGQSYRRSQILVPVS